MIALHGELGEADCLPATGKPERVGDGTEARPRSQAGEAVDRAQRDMHREAAGQGRADLVRHARALAFGLAPGADPLAAAAMQSQWGLLAHCFRGYSWADPAASDLDRIRRGPS